MVDLKELIKINGSDAIAEIRLNKTSSKADEDGNETYKKRVDTLYLFEAKMDQYGSLTSYDKVVFTRSQIMDMYSAIQKIENSEEIKKKPSDIDDDLPW